jgi:hypothetical protein
MRPGERQIDQAKRRSARVRPGSIARFLGCGPAKINLVDELAKIFQWRIAGP